MSKRACKELIDNGGMLQGLSEMIRTTSKTQAQSLAMFGVAENKDGEKWLEKSAKFQSKAIETLTDLLNDAQELCMSQPFE